MPGDGAHQLGGQALADLDDPLALRARHVMVVTDAADAVTMGAIGERHAIEQPLLQQHVYRPVDGRASDVRIHCLELPPEVMRRKVISAGSERGQALGNEAARTGIAQPHRVERRQHAVGNPSGPFRRSRLAHLGHDCRAFPPHRPVDAGARRAMHLKNIIPHPAAGQRDSCTVREPPQADDRAVIETMYH